MKHLTIIAILLSLFTATAFAEGQTSTECPMMKEMHRRTNTKLNLSKVVKKKANLNNTTVIQ